MAHTVIGTAGHIDHGKTALVKALTGTDTDRAPEEKARGITIELGFAFLGDEATIIDVPGHERFVKTMVAGVSTIDVAVLVIAADDGVMPQSREHLDVLQLMGVRRGLVAVNKIDLVDAEWADLVEEEVKELVTGTFLEGAPVVQVSAQTGEGVDELGCALRGLVGQVEARRTSGLLRMPVDRAFQVKGFGAICTGTVLSGRLRQGDAVDLLPAGRRLRVRGLQRHGVEVPEVSCGDRAAANVAGPDVGEAERGQVLAAAGALEPTYMLDVHLELLGSAPAELTQRTRVRFHIGTSEVMGRVVLLDGDAMPPGQRGRAQLRLEGPVVACWGDRFVIRRYSPAVTIGGGRVLAVHPARHRPGDRAVAGRLGGLDVEDAADALVPRLALEPTGCLAAPRLAAELGVDGAGLQVFLGPLVSAGRVIEVDVQGVAYLIGEAAWRDLVASMMGELERFHAAQPEERGTSREGLRRAAARALAPELFAGVLARLEKEGRIAVDGPAVGVAGREISLDSEQAALAARLEATLLAAGVGSAVTRAILGELVATEDKGGAPRPREVASALTALINMGSVLVLEGDLLMHLDEFERVRGEVRRYLEEHGEITVSQFRELISSNRRYAMALLNRLDGDMVTERRGDVRVLR